MAACHVAEGWPGLNSIKRGVRVWSRFQPLPWACLVHAHSLTTRLLLCRDFTEDERSFVDGLLQVGVVTLVTTSLVTLCHG